MMSAYLMKSQCDPPPPPLVKNYACVKPLDKQKYRSAFDPEEPCTPSPLGPVRSRRQRSGSEGQAALRETQEGGSPILSLHHTSHLFSRLAGA